MSRSGSGQASNDPMMAGKPDRNVVCWSDSPELVMQVRPANTRTFVPPFYLLLSCSAPYFWFIGAGVPKPTSF